jgi:hypothetical protein
MQPSCTRLEPCRKRSSNTRLTKNRRYRSFRYPFVIRYSFVTTRYPIRHSLFVAVPGEGGFCRRET